MLELAHLPYDLRAELEELLSHFNDEDKATPEKNKFPVDPVEIRPVSTTRDRIVRSKTLHIDTIPKPGSDNKLNKFDVPGPIRIVFDQGSPTTLEKNDSLKFENGELKTLRKHERNVIPTVIKRDVQFTKMHMNKKEVQLCDSHERSYRFIFEDAKAAKHFTDVCSLKPSPINEKTSIKFMLKKFLSKRSSREQLEVRGILQDEAIFGNTLENIYNVNHRIPEFVTKTIELIERPENIKTMGLYRTSGNLATIQKIRLQADVGKLDMLYDYEKDVDVLTGSLKLFFRELKVPLLPSQVSEEIHKLKDTEKNSAHCDKVEKIIQRLPQANRETLSYLLRHLLKVVQYKEDNKMDIHNICVCWSPSIFAAPPDCQNILTFTTTASKSLEFLLEYYQMHEKELELTIARDVHDTLPRKIHRQESKDSLTSNDSLQTKTLKKSPSDGYMSEDFKVIRKVVELIELNLGSEGLYRVPGSSAKVEKCLKKMLKRKISDLDKYSKDTHDLAGALKRFVRELQETLIPKEIFEEFSKICDITEDDRLQKKMILPKIETTQQFQTLKYLMDHLRRVIENDANKVTAPDLLTAWMAVLTPAVGKEQLPNPRHERLIATLFDIYINQHFVDRPRRENLYAMPDVIKEVQSRQQRASSYDNVPDIEVRKD